MVPISSEIDCTLGRAPETPVSVFPDPELVARGCRLSDCRLADSRLPDCRLPGCRVSVFQDHKSAARDCRLLECGFADVRLPVGRLPGWQVSPFSDFKSVARDCRLLSCILPACRLQDSCYCDNAPTPCCLGLFLLPNLYSLLNLKALMPWRTSELMEVFFCFVF